ncbi:hypothetical protein JHD48_09960, partial [Sulfurimonas sp. SAG-AH-194-I05]
MVRKYLRIALPTATLFLLAGCSSGGSSSTAGVSTAYFLDSAVVGASYATATQSGVTGAGGAFTYISGETVTFKIGNATIGSISSIPSDGKVLPSDIAGVARGVTTTAVSNIAQFLQSLDDDGDPNNGINISSSVRNAITTTLS